MKESEKPLLRQWARWGLTSQFDCACVGVLFVNSGVYFDMCTCACICKGMHALICVHVCTDNYIHIDTYNIKHIYEMFLKFKKDSR